MRDKKTKKWIIIETFALMFFAVLFLMFSEMKIFNMVGVLILLVMTIINHKEVSLFLSLMKIKSWWEEKNRINNKHKKLLNEFLKLPYDKKESIFLSENKIDKLKWYHNIARWDGFMEWFNGCDLKDKQRILNKLKR